MHTMNGNTLQQLVLLATLPTLIQGWIVLPSHHHRASIGLSATSKTHQESPITANERQPPELSRQQFGQLLFGSLAVLPFTTQNANAMVNDPKTGIALPEPGEIESAIPTDWDGIDNPFDGNPQFGRLDSKPDSIFYADPRFVEHVDEQAVQSMTKYITKQAIPQQGGNNIAVLDLCSSWTSHIDMEALSGNKPQRISGLGMNAKELENNPVLNDFVVKDLNENPVLPYEDQSFDVVLCQLSIDYLTKPKQVLKEVSRVLRPGGTVHILFSNRLFLSKAVALWTGADDIDHAFTVGCYLRFCDGGYKNIQAKDLSTRKGRDQRISGDPLYVVTATKS